VNASEFLRPRIRVLGLLTAAGFIAAAGTVAGWLGRWAWWLDLASHFRVQFAIVLVLLAIAYAWARKWRWTAGAAALACLNLAVVLPHLLPMAPAAPRNGKALRAMLINVNTQRGNPEAVLASIRAEKPDFLVLEEVDERWLTALAPAFDVFPCRAVETRDDNFGIGFFSRQPCAASRVITVGDAGVPSVLGRVDVDGAPLTVIGTHALPPGGPAYSRYRNDQLRKVAERVRAIRGPVLLLGDLNVSPWSPHFRDFLDASGLRDSSRGRGLHPTWPTFHPILRIPIDHCLHSDDIAIVSLRVAESVGSDHFPLVVDFTCMPPALGSP
jgi:endonuclease/exonuclease/phosphatase (EEP) superfamily protein YafD